MILVEADVSEEWDSSIPWDDLARRAVGAAVGMSAFAHPAASLEVSVKFTGDEEVRSLNAAWRGKDRATNVLSFPMLEADQLSAGFAAAGAEVLLGDIVLAHGVCAREAADKRVSVADHAAHLVVHGTLHLLGYDHEEGEEEADEMERLERRALASLGIADPYLSEAGH